MPPQPPHRKSYTYGSVLGKPGGALTAEPRAYSRDQLRSLPSLENNYKMSQSMRAFIHERSLMALLVPVNSRQLDWGGRPNRDTPSAAQRAAIEG